LLEEPDFGGQFLSNGILGEAEKHLGEKLQSRALQSRVWLSTVMWAVAAPREYSTKGRIAWKRLEAGILGRAGWPTCGGDGKHHASAQNGGRKNVVDEKTVETAIAIALEQDLAEVLPAGWKYWLHHAPLPCRWPVTQSEPDSIGIPDPSAK